MARSIVPSARSRRILFRIVAPLLTFLVGAACSFLAFSQARDADNDRVRSILELRAEWRARDFENKIADVAGPVEDIRNFVVAQKEIETSTFQAFATQAGKGLPVSRLIWAPIVTPAERAAFEAATGREAENPAYKIIESNDLLRLVTAGDRPSYAPVQFEQRFDPRPSLLGFDNLSDPARREAAERARDIGAPVATTLVAPILAEEAAPRVAVIFPVYTRPIVPPTVAERRATIRGYAIGVYGSDEVFQYAIANTPHVVERLSVLVDKPDVAPGSVPIVQYQAEKPEGGAATTAIGLPAEGGLRLVRDFDYLGRTWTLVFDFAPDTVVELRSNARWGYLALGLILSLAVAGYIAAQQRRQRFIEATVTERTEELTRMQTLLNGIVESSDDAIISKTLDGIVTTWNAAAEKIFGYTAAEMIGRPIAILSPLGREDDMVEVLNLIKQGERVSHYETERRCKNGTIVDVSLTVSPIRDTRGNIIGASKIVRDITEQKRAAATERELTERLRGIVDTAPDGIVLIDERGSIMLFNPAAEHLFGYTAEEALGQNVKMLMPASYAHEHDGYLADYQRTGHRKVIGIGRDVVGRHKDGSTFPMHLAVGEIEQSGRRIFAGIIHDLTATKVAENALRLSKEHLARVQSIAHIGSSEYFFKTGEATWSDEIYHFLGIPPVSNPSVSVFMDHVHPDDRAKLTELALRGRTGKEVEAMEFRVVGADGAVRWYYRQSQVIRDDSGEPFSQVATVFDITDRKLAEAARLASEEQYQLTFDTAPVGIAHLDLNGKYMLVNQTLCRMFQYSEAELMSRNFRDLTYPEDLAVSNHNTLRLINRESPSITWDKRFIRRDGSLLWCQLTSTLAEGDAKTPQHFITVYSDVTAAKLGETRRQELEAQLIQSQKMEAVGRLTGGVAHDFNNLLTVVLGNLELVREHVEGNARLVRQIDSALAAGKRGADLTHRLLAFSRRQPLEPVVVDINGRIGELVPMLHRALGETIEIKTKLGQRLSRVVVDPGQLENAILNLAVNSRDAMPDGGKLEIVTENLTVDEAYAAKRQELVPGDYVRISVSDSGIGMPPEVMAKAFDPFFTTKDVGKGTGLGLSMVYGFVKQSGGHATIYSEVGIGTTVSLLLPADPTTAAEARHREADAPLRGTETILVVEDDPAVRAVTVAFLDALGYSVVPAGTVAEGFELFQALPGIDLILTDVILPGGADGADLAQRARVLRPSIKVLFMSGYTEDVIMHNGRLDPGVALLRKPFTRGQLAKKVRASIDGQAADS